ncbi:MAG: hypothetical protein K2O65_14460 [Lachnospiraceae bacterium]|nr:hypothetical protein [Lachnospiraceae bacterium]
MSKCENCMTCNFICVGCLGTSIIDHLDSDLRSRRKSPSKIILGKDMFDIIKKEMKQTGTYGLSVNLKGEYVELFGMKIVTDEYCRLKMAYVFQEDLDQQPDQKGDYNE